jgi:hypothetical protein
MLRGLALRGKCDIALWRKELPAVPLVTDASAAFGRGPRANEVPSKQDTFGPMANPMLQLRFCKGEGSWRELGPAYTVGGHFIAS